jgi:hypothetical protein
MPEDEWKKFRPDVFAVFEKRVNNSTSKMDEIFEFIARNKIKAKARIFEAGTSKRACILVYLLKLSKKANKLNPLLLHL